MAVIDTGVEFGHPHVRRPPLGCGVRSEGGVAVVEGDFDDPVGHGTCVAALVLWLAPTARIDAIRAVGPDLLACAEDLAAAIEVAARRGAEVINVSVGTADSRHFDRLHRAVESAVATGARVVAAAPEGGRDVLPAGLPEVVAVGPAPPGVSRVIRRAEGFPPLLAPCEARPFEGRRANFSGPSLAAAFVSAHLARGEPLPLASALGTGLPPRGRP